MKKKEIESMLSTDVPFKASDSLKGRIMEKAAREEPAAVRARSWKWARWAMPVAAALALAVLVTVKPGVTPAIAAEKLFRTAAEYFSQRPLFSAKVEVRTLPFRLHPSAETLCGSYHDRGPGKRRLAPGEIRKGRSV